MGKPHATPRKAELGLSVQLMHHPVSERVDEQEGGDVRFLRVSEWNVLHDRAFTDWNKLGRRNDSPTGPPAPDSTHEPPSAPAHPTRNEERHDDDERHAP